MKAILLCKGGRALWYQTSDQGIMNSLNGFLFYFSFEIINLTNAKFAHELHT